jgi:uncharacterized repeat protein (TIGR03803 family)
MKSKVLHLAFTRLLTSLALMALLVSASAATSHYKVLYYFRSIKAFYPLGPLVADGKGNLYGVVSGKVPKCGYRGCGGIVFKLTPMDKGQWNYTAIHLFYGNDGLQTNGGLIFDSSGNLYGTTTQGGAIGCGTVFELSPGKTGWTEKILYSFSCDGQDLATPYAGGTIDQSGNLYGTASGGDPTLKAGFSS